MGRKAVFLDVDGTYVNDRGVVPESARRAVVAARANGHQVFLCTGRAVAELWDHIMEAGFDGLVASAGGYVELDGQVLLHRSLSEDDVRHVVEFFDTHGVEYYLEANSGLYGSRNSKSRLRELVFALIVDQDLVRSDINKVSFLDSDLPLDRVRAEFAGTLQVIPTTVPMFGPNSGEMSIPGIHKATAIELLLEHAGIAREDTLAYGDGLNDLEMIEYVHTGIAMSNAHPILKAAADGVTGDPDSDGIYASFTALGLI